METVFDDKGNIIEVWLTRAEAENSIVKSQLTNIIQRYGTKQRKVIVFYSGKENLADKTEALIKANKKKLYSESEFCK